MPQMDRPPLPSYEELFLTPRSSMIHSSFDALPGFSTSSSISSSTPRLKSASIASSTVSCGGDSISQISVDLDPKIPFGDENLHEDANNNASNNDKTSVDAVDGELNGRQDSLKVDASVISVRERAKKLNKLQSESELNPPRRSHGSSFLSTPEQQRPGGRRSVAAGNGDALPVNLTKELRKWMVTSATANYHPIAKMISENKKLVHFKDFVTGYTPLHWAAKSGQVELIKLIAGSNAPVNSKSNGGYTPLHLAYIQGHRDAAEILTNVYKADPNIRDNDGKQPRGHNPLLARELGDVGETCRPESHSTSASATSSSGISRWGFRTSGPKTGDSKSGWKSNKVERKGSRAEKKDFKYENEGKGKTEEEKWEARRMKPTKKNQNVAGVKGIEESDYEKTTQVTFV